MRRAEHRRTLGALTALALAPLACGARSELRVEPPPAVDAAVPHDVFVPPASMCDWPTASRPVQLSLGPEAHDTGDLVAVPGGVLLATRGDGMVDGAQTRLIGTLGEALPTMWTPVLAPRTSAFDAISLAWGTSGPHGLLADDTAGCWFVPLDDMGAASGPAVDVGSGVLCTSLHAAPTGGFQFVSHGVGTTVSLDALAADGHSLGQTTLISAMGPTTLPFPVAAFGDDGTLALLLQTFATIDVASFDAAGVARGPQHAIESGINAGQSAITATPTGFLVVYQLQTAGALFDVALADDGSPSGPVRALGPAFDTSIGAVPPSFDIAYASGDVLLVESVGNAPATMSLQLAALTPDGTPRLGPLHLLNGPSFNAPRVIATSAGAVIVYTGPASVTTDQVFSIGVTCLR